MTTKKKAKVLLISDDVKCRRHYNIPPTAQLNEDELIDWLAQVANEEKYDWGWIRRELNRRFSKLNKQVLEKQKNYDDLWTSHYRDLDRLETQIAEIKKLYGERLEQVVELEHTLEELHKVSEAHKLAIAELEQSMDLRTDADDRAIKLWQEANPGNDHVWPDAAKLSVWLMKHVVELEDERRKQDMRITELQEDNARAHAELLKD